MGERNNSAQRIAVLGFGPVARAVVDKVKRFPEYGTKEDDSPYAEIYVVYVRRNSFTYSPDLVVEVADDENNASRTYNDGLQGIRKYETTVAYDREWLIDQVRINQINVIVDCTSYNESSVQLMRDILDVANEGTEIHLPSKELVAKHWEELIELAKNKKVSLKFNSIPSGDPNEYDEVDLNEETFLEYLHQQDQTLFIYRNGGPQETADRIVKDIRKSLDGGQPWQPVEFSEEFLAEAEKLAKAAEEKINRISEEDKKEIVQQKIDSGVIKDPRATLFMSNIYEENELETLQRFVVNAERDEEYYRHEWYDHEQKCLVIKHEMLNWFFGRNKIEHVAAATFLEYDLKITSARYYKFDSPESQVKQYLPGGSCGWGVEYIISQDEPWPLFFTKGHIEVLPYVEQGQAITARFGAGLAHREPLRNTNNKQVEILYFHLAKPINGVVPGCKCYIDGEEEEPEEDKVISSVCLFGLGDKGRDFLQKYKSLDYYKDTDADVYAVRIHTAHVLDASEERYKDIRYIYFKEPEGNFSCIKDGDEKTPRETPFSDDHPWLATSNGHDTVVEFVDGDVDKYFEIIFPQVKPHYKIHLTTPEFIEKYGDQIKRKAEEVNAEIFTYEASSNPVSDVMNALEKEYERKKQHHIEHMSRPEEERRRLDEEAERQRERELAQQGEACGLEDNVDWSKF